MGGDVGADRAGGEIGFDNQRGLSDQLGGVQSRDVDPEDLPVLPVYLDLHEPADFTRDPGQAPAESSAMDLNPSFPKFHLHAVRICSGQATCGRDCASFLRNTIGV